MTDEKVLVDRIDEVRFLLLRRAAVHQVVVGSPDDVIGRCPDDVIGRCPDDVIGGRTPDGQLAGAAGPVAEPVRVAISLPAVLALLQFGAVVRVAITTCVKNIKHLTHVGS